MEELLLENVNSHKNYCSIPQKFWNLEGIPITRDHIHVGWNSHQPNYIYFVQCNKQINSSLCVDASPCKSKNKSKTSSSALGTYLYALGSDTLAKDFDESCSVIAQAPVTYPSIKGRSIVDILRQLSSMGPRHLWYRSALPCMKPSLLISIVSLTAAQGTLCLSQLHEADVYSFGMLLMEMVGRRKNLNERVEQSSQIYFPTWIYKQLDRGEDMMLNEVTEGEKKLVRRMIMVALWCIQMNPTNRPSMSKALEVLEGEVELLEMPPKPFVFFDNDPPSTNLVEEIFKSLDSMTSNT
ncbi:hypothetical protein SLEP1_g35035 [Rubroshorea leprosula]|uniref:Protein kinase domain-containing protein n=1 Tax=Rubroshorea leprosula TaxID=152421 RepID=A0AAV5KLZ1_9ROSI|nr:hypothetical protein SLEP1_g35035 [Rubroshorea leprosula]